MANDTVDEVRQEVEDPGFVSQSSSDVLQKSTRFESCSSSTGSSDFANIPEETQSGSNYLSNEILPRMSNYRLTFRSAFRSKVRPTVDELLTDSGGNMDVEKPEPEVAEDAGKAGKSGKVIKLGWMQGVLMKCMLNIWGVMLYLRLTWVVGQAGLVEGLFIIGIANLVTIITATSMSAVCTNGTIKAGGVYYMISRNLGPEFGGAIGLMFFLANSIAVSMYLIGFCESLLDCLQQYGGFSGITDDRLNDIRIIGISSLIAIFILAVTGMGWVTRVQVGLLALLIVSQVDFVVGTFIPPSDELKAKGFIGYNATLMESNLWSAYTFNEESGSQHNFFSVFAVFFPAVTGIVAGANMSGDLKDPTSAIPKGTLLSIAVTAVSYLGYAVLAAGCSLRAASGVLDEVLFAQGSLNETYIEDRNISRAFDDCEGRQCSYGLLYSQQMMEVMSAWGPLIYAGCFAATLSSAIGSLEGAPRVFQALAKDKLLPGFHFFAKGRGANNDPVRGYVLVTVIALVCLLIGKLNIVSSLLSNFFVAAYGLINLCVVHVSITKSPSWRPKYKYYSMWVSLAGTVLCVIVMFMMDWKTALATYIIIILLCIAIQKNRPDANWGSSTQSQAFLTALKSVHNLTKVEEHIKNYRPKIILLSGVPADRPCLVDFANLITKRLSLLECVNVIDDVTDWKKVELVKQEGSDWLKKNHVKAFYSVSRHSSFVEGARISMELSGIGKMRPNMLLVGFKESWMTAPGPAKDYYKILQSAFEMKLSVAVLRISGGFDLAGCDLSNDLEIKSGFSQSKSHLSVDSGLDELRDLPPPSPSTNTPPASIGGRQDPESGLTSMRRTVIDSLMKLNKSKAAKPALTKGNGEEIQNAEIITRMFQFRNVEPVQGYLDVYWLYDDGGLTLLMAYILSTRKRYVNCKLRIFVLPKSDSDLEEERLNMIALLKKFRIKFEEIVVMADVTRHPGKVITNEFEEMIQAWVVPEGAAREHESRDKPAMMTSSDLIKNQDKTNFHLRLGEILRERSRDASMILMTLPMPKKEDSLPFGLYLGWLDIMSKQMPPFLFIRGNQEPVLTFYS